MIIAALALAVASAAAPAADQAVSALREAENRWSQAFMGGDAAYLDQLLLPGYVSVGQTGASHDKAEVITSAQRYAAQHPGAKPSPMPATSTIEVRGNSAIVRHHGQDDVSVDVFVWRDGRWQAWYSQHTAVKPAGRAGREAGLRGSAAGRRSVRPARAACARRRRRRSRRCRR